SGGAAPDHRPIDGASTADAFNVTATGFAHGSVGGSFDTVEVFDAHAGQFTFGADVNGLLLNVDGSAIFNVSQHLGGLNISATGRGTVTAGGAKLIDTQAL